MAKLTIEVDTDSKTIEVSLDGNKLSNVTHASVSKYMWENSEGEKQEEFYASVTQEAKGENGVTVSLNYSARGSEGWQETKNLTFSKACAELRERLSEVINKC